MAGFGTELDTSIGCLFIGVVLSLALYGVVCAQVAYYFWNYRRDKLAIRVWVVLAWILQSAQIATDIHQLWFYMIRAHSDFFAVAALDPVTGGQSLLSHALMVIVQWYFLHRIWQLLEGAKLRLAYAGLAIFLSSMTLGRNGLWSLSAAFVTDLYITSTLCYTLNHQKHGIQRTDSILTRLVIYAINRGAILCLASFVAIVLWVIDSKRGTAYTEAISAPGQGTLYANALLAVLNVRHHLCHLDAPATCDMDTADSRGIITKARLPWARKIHDGLPHFVIAVPVPITRSTSDDYC